MVSLIEPLRRVDKETVVRLLRDAGTRDLDLLYAKKLHLMAETVTLRRLGTGLMVGGLVLTGSVVLAAVGIPALLAGWWIRSRATRRIATVEAGFVEFTRR